MADLKVWPVLIGLMMAGCSTGDDDAIHTPPHTRLEAPGVTFMSHKNNSLHVALPSDRMIYPFTLTAIGPLGGRTVRAIRSEADLIGLTITEGLIRLKDSNPPLVEQLPQLCPRLRAKKSIIPWKDSHPSTWIYDGAQDALNNTPSLQFMDPDRLDALRTFTHMDGKNVLALKEITLSYDYEDNHIVDYTGPDPITRSPVMINEGDGGFYANLHYAIFPHKEDIARLDPQTLLNIAQGRAAEIGKPELKPSLRAHSLLPGPFWSGDNYMYSMCEWGDTAYQSPSQHLDYENVALWDWDFDKSHEEVWLVVWEGDEEDWLIQKKRLDPLYLTDDLVGVFHIKRADTLAPLILMNKSKNFKMTVQTTKIKMSR